MRNVLKLRGTMLFGKSSMRIRMEVSNRCSIIALVFLTVSILLLTKKLLFWKKMLRSGNLILCRLSQELRAMTPFAGLSSDGEQRNRCSTFGELNETLKRVRASCEPTQSSLITPPPDRGAEYCDERVRLSVCLRSLSSEIHIRSSPNFMCALTMAVIRSSSGGVVICYVLPVLRMTSFLLISLDWSTSPPS